jgi:hypothetical protein
MPNRTEAAKRKRCQLATGRLQPLRLFSTPPSVHASKRVVPFAMSLRVSFDGKAVGRRCWVRSR